MRNYCVLLTLLSLLSLPAHAAKLEFADDLALLAVNGKDVGSGWFSEPAPIELTAGNHKIALQYEQVAEGDNPRMDEFIRSEPMLLTLEVEENHTYQLVTHSLAKEAPRQFAKNPKVKVVRKDGGDVRFSVALLIERKQSKWSKLTQDYDSAAKPVVLSDMEKLTSPLVATVDPKESAVIMNETAVDVSREKGLATGLASKMLSYWWAQADPANRDAFLKQVRAR